MGHLHHLYAPNRHKGAHTIWTLNIALARDFPAECRTRQMLTCFSQTSILSASRCQCTV